MHSGTASLGSGQHPGSEIQIMIMDTTPICIDLDTRPCHLDHRRPTAVAETIEAALRQDGTTADWSDGHGPIRAMQMRPERCTALRRPRQDHPQHLSPLLSVGQFSVLQAGVFGPLMASSDHAVFHG